MMNLLLDVLPVEPEMEEIEAGGSGIWLGILFLGVFILFIAIYVKKKREAANKPEEAAGSDAVEATEAKESDEKTEN